MRWPSASRAKVRTCLTISAPRSALCSINETSRSRFSADISSRNNGAAISTGDSTLFRSCATPLASVPMLSSRWVRRNCCSNRFCSVRSVFTTRTEAAWPSRAGTVVQRLRTVTLSPSRRRCCTSPDHCPRSTSMALAAKNVGGSSYAKSRVFRPKTSSALHP